MSSIRNKYNKVKKLVSEGATEGERVAAKEAMLRMEQKYPELINPTVKGYQADKIYIDELANLSKAMQEMMVSIVETAFSRGHIRFGMDMSSGSANNIQTWWQQNSDGTWKQIK